MQKEQNCSEALWNESRTQEQSLKEKVQKTQLKKESQTEELRKTEEMLSRCMITSEYREALEQFTLRYNELTGILRERKEKEQKTDQKKAQLRSSDLGLVVVGTKAGDCRTERKDDGSRKAAGTLERRGSRVQ